MLSKSLKTSLLLSILSMPVSGISHADSERVFFDIHNPSQNTAEVTAPTRSRAGYDSNVYLQNREGKKAQTFQTQAVQAQGTRKYRAQKNTNKPNAAQILLEQSRSRPAKASQSYNQDYGQAKSRPEMVVIEASPEPVVKSRVYKPATVVQNYMPQHVKSAPKHTNNSVAPSRPAMQVVEPEPFVQPIERQRVVVTQPVRRSVAPKVTSQEVAHPVATTTRVTAKNAGAKHHFTPIKVVKTEVEKEKDRTKAKQLKARGELNHRYSNDRAITMAEMWIPLAQDSKRNSVVYGDLRVMGDNNDNEEYNVGLGYREVVKTPIIGDAVAGAHVWYDKRNTLRGSNFHQITTGVELLGETNDIRINGYVPLNKSEIQTQANPNGTQANFVGNQIVVNTDQTVREEALGGADIEVGHRLGFMDGITDATRVYAGAYHFSGGQTEDVSGWRARVSSDITQDIQVGARYQDDDVRGAQTYLEATVRFPFSAKKSFKEEGVRSRLDESPERDIDIVSNNIIIDSGVNQKIINRLTGLPQEVIHVDNTAGGGGDGSVINPYNTLAGAEAAAGVGDIIYVNSGDGLTTGQNAGITLDDAGQMLAGSGTDLLFDPSRLTTSNGNGLSGDIVIANKTAAPVITNGAGNGIDVVADNIKIQGVTVDGASALGINAENTTGLAWSKVDINDMTTINNGDVGILVRGNAGSSIGDVSILNAASSFNAGNGISVISRDDVMNNVFIDNVTTDNNTGRGVYVLSWVNGTIENTTVSNSTIESNGRDGIFINNLANATMENVLIQGNTVNNNTDAGIFFVSQGATSVINNADVLNNTSNNNGDVGYLAFALGGTIDEMNITNNVADGNGQDGFKVSAFAGSGVFTQANLSNNISTNNTGSGFVTEAELGGNFLTADYFANQAINNTDRGFYDYSETAGNITTVSHLLDFAENNTDSGFELRADGVGSTIANASYGLSSADANGVQGFIADARDSGSLGTIDYTLNASSNSTNNGFYTHARDGGTVTDVNFVSNTATGNTESGFYANTRDAGSDIASVTYDTSIASDNGRSGFRARAISDASITEFGIEESESRENALYGVELNDESTAGSIGADLGGGASGSVGNNAIINNASEEIYVDLDGAELKATDNYWEDASGLPGGEALLIDGSTIDATPFLTEDP